MAVKINVSPERVVALMDSEAGRAIMADVLTYNAAGVEDHAKAATIKARMNRLLPREYGRKQTSAPIAAACRKVYASLHNVDTDTVNLSAAVRDEIETLFAMLSSE